MDLEPDLPPDGVRERTLALAMAGLFALVAALAAVDLAGDIGHGGSLFHVLVEGGLLAAGLLGIIVVTRRLVELRRSESAARHEAAELRARMSSLREEAARWRAEAKDVLSGLGAAIERQLVRWGLTAAEREVALLLLKGLSHKQVGEARGVSETTVRQQSRAIYRKAGVEGRHDLAAFFLEGVFVEDVAADRGADRESP